LADVSQKFSTIYLATQPDMPEFPKNAGIEFWFKPYMFEPLAKLRAAIHAVIATIPADYQEAVRNLLACVFSDTVRSVSLTYRGEIRLRKLQGHDLEKFNPDVLNEFKKRMNEAFYRVSLLPLNLHAPIIRQGTVTNIPVPDKAYDLVITSPPYGDIKNTIPYHQFSKNMLYWLGHGDEAIEQIKLGSLGARGNQGQTPNSQTFSSVLNEMQTPNRIREAIAFYSDYNHALVEIIRVTSEKIIIVIGHRVLDGVLIDNPQITTELMANLGWQLETVYKRTIRKKRLNRKMGFGNNAQGATIDSECILVYCPGC
jgi:site-specific DNA-methyltransferase (cytosine-N4-specific)